MISRRASRSVEKADVIVTSRVTVSFVLLSLLTADLARGQDTSVEITGTKSVVESATFLLVPVGARSVGIGEANTALRNSSEGVLWNPATLATLAGPEVFYLRASDFGSVSQVPGVAWRFGEVRVAASYFDFNLGSVDARDAANQNIGTLDIRNRSLTLSGAAPVTDWLDVGVNLKLLQLSYGCSEACASFDLSSTGLAFDLGGIASIPGVPGLDVGLLLRNLGGGLSVGEGAPSDPLPTRIRLGGAYRILDSVTATGEPAPVDLRVMADLQQTWTEFDDFDFFVGAEAGFRQIVYARAGYAASSPGRSGPAIGIGLRYVGFYLDLGRAFNDFTSYADDQPFQLSIGYGF